MHLDKILNKVNSAIKNKTAIKQLDLKRISHFLIELQQIRNFAKSIQNCPKSQIDNAMKNFAKLLGIMSASRIKKNIKPLTTEVD